MKIVLIVVLMMVISGCSKHSMMTSKASNCEATIDFRCDCNCVENEEDEEIIDIVEAIAGTAVVAEEVLK